MVTKVGLVGLGTVGSEVCLRLMERKGLLSVRAGMDLELTAVAEPDVPTDLEEHVSGLEYYESAGHLIEESSVDVLVELIGGINPAEQIIRDALKTGTNVVTANKELLAHRGAELFELADKRNQRIRFEAGVGGCIPVVRSIREAMVDVDFSAIYGIINGTSNYVLSRMRSDEIPFDEALEIARNRGFAEADPSYDVEGTDTVHKLIILSELAFGTRLDYEAVYCKGIERITPEIIRDAKKFGYRIKLLGISKKKEDGIEARVHPTLIPEDSPLAAVEEQYNAVLTQGEPVGTNMFTGKGAGGSPTATAVVSDLISLSRSRDSDRFPYLYRENPVPTIPISKIESRFYLRLMARDRPGVLSRVTKILGDRDISIDSVLQVGRSEENLVPVLLTTHRAKESQMSGAVESIANLESVGGEPVCLHIEEGLDRY